MNDLNDLNDRTHELQTKKRGRLCALAALWRTAAKSDVFSRHEYDHHPDTFFCPTFSNAVVQVDQVVLRSENSDLHLNDQAIPRSFRSFSAWATEAPAQSAQASPWGLTPNDVREGFAKLNPAALPDVPGTPPEWRAGVGKLRATTAPLGIDPHRWVRYQHDALRLLCEQGADLHAAGWDALELFGLHRIAPDRRTDAMGVAWLMRERVVTAITQEAVSLTAYDGAVLRATRLGRQARNEALLAWELSHALPRKK